jgi:C1A family cysteine protease
MPAALAALEEDGQCEEAAWPYGDAVASDPNATYFRAEADSRQRMDLMDAATKVLSEGRAALLVLRLTESWFAVNADGLVPAPTHNDRFAGRHAVVAAGYDAARQRVLVRNSWGAGWGDGGYAWLPHDYVETYGLEVATLVTVPPSVDADDHLQRGSL